MEVWDGDWKLFSHDQALGRTTWVQEKWEGGKVITTYRTDYQVDHILKDNAEARAESHGRRFGEWSRIASVPINMLYEGYLAEAVNAQDKTATSRWLNDGDNRAFRTKEGRV